MGAVRRYGALALIYGTLTFCHVVSLIKRPTWWQGVLSVVFGLVTLWLLVEVRLARRRRDVVPAERQLKVLERV
ncbi:hypothetical protein [Lentzea sp. NPDC051838]|uniref:hypothetical protein n=1 Tax=Lentzea sp. NPDC051838 TaxID=3154849 RepID=UPI003428C624